MLMGLFYGRLLSALLLDQDGGKGGQELGDKEPIHHNFGQRAGLRLSRRATNVTGIGMLSSDSIQP